MKTLKDNEFELLKDVVLKHNPALLYLLESLGTVPLSDDHKEEMRELVADELIETGLGADDEPNSRGLLLEHLIDLLGHL